MKLTHHLLTSESLSYCYSSPHKKQIPIPKITAHKRLAEDYHFAVAHSSLCSYCDAELLHVIKKTMYFVLYFPACCLC